MKITKASKDGVFLPENVEVKTPLVEDLINAERISGKSSGFEFLAAVAASVCVFDGTAQPAEEVQKLAASDFLDLSEAMGLNGGATAPSE